MQPAIRILQTRLPTLLVTPLPQEILSPQITLRLFPSTHPHLPVVSGRLAYTAALWTSPVAWGRVPVVGNVRLEILSERMVRNGAASPRSSGDEKLIVRWKTGRPVASSGTSMTDMISKMLNVLGGDTKKGAEEKNGDFHGIFIFEFDEEGRILSHTIEHVEQGNIWERTAKVISVTDWLLGKAWRKEGAHQGLPELAFCGEEAFECGKKKDESK
jgi:Mitochondrial protein up-regulated during meiosis